MKELIELLDRNNIPYEKGFYGFDTESIVIKKNKHQIEIYETERGLVSDLQKIPYSWGRMGSTNLEEIKNDLRVYLNIDLSKGQTNIFDFMED